MDNNHPPLEAELLQMLSEIDSRYFANPQSTDMQKLADVARMAQAGGLTKVSATAQGLIDAATRAGNVEGTAKLVNPLAVAVEASAVRSLKRRLRIATLGAFFLLMAGYVFGFLTGCYVGGAEEEALREQIDHLVYEKEELQLLIDLLQKEAN